MIRMVCRYNDFTDEQKLIIIYNLCEVTAQVSGFERRRGDGRQRQRHSAPRPLSCFALPYVLTRSFY